MVTIHYLIFRKSLPLSNWHSKQIIPSLAIIMLYCLCSEVFILFPLSLSHKAGTKPAEPSLSQANWTEKTKWIWFAGFPSQISNQKSSSPLRAPSWSAGSSLNEEGLQYRATTLPKSLFSWFIAVEPITKWVVWRRGKPLGEEGAFPCFHGKGKGRITETVGTECISKPQESWLWGGSEIQIDTGTPRDGKSLLDHFWCPNSTVYMENGKLSEWHTNQEPHSQSRGFTSQQLVWSGFLCWWWLS